MFVHGSVVQDITGFDKETGEPFYNKREHPLMKHATALNNELIKFADSLEFSPKAQSRKKTNDQMVDDNRSIVSSIMQRALKKRSEE